MRVYISGKIGEEVISEATRQKFAKAEKMLKAKGYEVFNPTDGEWQEHLHQIGDKVGFYVFALLHDIMMLVDCDAIYMLPDFLESPGAKAEYAFAIATKKQVYYDDELFRDGTLRGKSYKDNRLPEVAP